MTASAEDEIGQATAATMRMRKIEGTVRASDKNSKSISVFQDMKLYDGYNIETLKNGYAWIELDSTKLIKLDAESRTVIQKSGKEMDIILKKGKLFFNVAQPLEEDESFFIRTSTTMVGIRGTCGWVEIVDKNTTRVFILEGTVTVAVIDPVSGEIKVDSVSGGDNVTCVVYGQTKPDDKCDIIRDRFSEEDVPGFVLVELVGDMKHVDEIFDRSKTDVDLRRLTKPAAKKRLQDEQEAVELAELTKAQLAAQKRAENKPQENNAASVSGSPVTPVTPVTPETRTFTVKFNSNGGSAVGSQTVEQGAALVEPAPTPTKDGHKFGGWFKDSACTQAWNFANDAVTEDTTLFAKWVMIVGNGTTGTLTWSVDETYTLTISGSGTMPDGSEPAMSAGGFPWHKKLFTSNIINVVVENGVTSIGSFAFAGLPNIKSITIPEGVTSIGMYAFRGCSGLESITIPKSLTSIEFGAFQYCSAAFNVNEDNTVFSSVDGVLFDKNMENLLQYHIGKQDSSYEIPNSVTSIGVCAFMGCKNLKSLIIPESVKSIGGTAFYTCSNFERIFIPKTMENIGAMAFVGCNKLNSGNVFFGGTPERWTALVSYSDYYERTGLPATLSPGNYNYTPPESTALLEEPENGETLLEMEEMSEKAVEFQEVKNALENEEAAVESKEPIEETDAESAATEVNETETSVPEETTSEESASAEETSTEAEEVTESEMSEAPESEF